jgi:hypothetical protein
MLEWALSWLEEPALLMVVWAPVKGGVVGDAGVSNRVVADAEPKCAVVEEGEREGCNTNVVCGVIVCTEMITSVVRTKEPLGIVIVLVLDINDVLVEVSNGAEIAMELELEVLWLVKISRSPFTCRTFRRPYLAADLDDAAATRPAATAPDITKRHTTPNITQRVFCPSPHIFFCCSWGGTQVLLFFARGMKGSLP